MEFQKICVWFVLNFLIFIVTFLIGQVGEWIGDEDIGIFFLGLYLQSVLVFVLQ